MKTVLCIALAMALSGPGVALADSAAGPSQDLPAAPQGAGLGVSPGRGATPGIVLLLDSPVARCSRDTARAVDRLMAPDEAMIACNEAVQADATTRFDLAGVLVNRAALLITLRRPQHAKLDLEQALAIQPDLAEALVNRGMLLQSEGRLQEALSDLNRGIELGPERPERAYYQRAMVREDLHDLSGAYSDYKTAEALRPGWEPVTAELARFRVRTVTRP